MSMKDRSSMARRMFICSEQDRECTSENERGREIESGRGRGRGRGREGEKKGAEGGREGSEGRREGEREASASVSTSACTQRRKSIASVSTTRQMPHASAHVSPPRPPAREGKQARQVCGTREVSGTREGKQAAQSTPARFRRVMSWLTASTPITAPTTSRFVVQLSKSCI